MHLWMNLHASPDCVGLTVDVMQLQGSLQHLGTGKWLHPGEFPHRNWELIFLIRKCFKCCRFSHHRPRYVPYPYTREMIEAGFSNWISLNRLNLGFSMMRSSTFLNVICIFMLSRCFFEVERDATRQQFIVNFPVDTMTAWITMQSHQSR